MDGRDSATAYVRPVDGVVAESSGDRQVVLTADGSSIVTLSPVGAIVWRHMPATRGSLLATLAERFAEIDTQQLAVDLDAFLDELRVAGIVGVGHADGSHADG